MESEYKISVNRIAEFPGATSKRKLKIIEEQKSPNKVKMFWYQLAKARIRKYFELKGDLQPLLDGIEQLKSRVPEKKNQKSDQMVSIEALQRFISMKKDNLLDGLEYEIYRPKEKHFTIYGLEIIVAPDIVFKAKIDNQIALGAIKFHISKSKPFDIHKSRRVSTTIHKYLTSIAKENEIVIPELCICIDLFGERIVSAPDNLDVYSSELKLTCSEILNNWNAA